MLVYIVLKASSGALRNSKPHALSKLAAVKLQPACQKRDNKARRVW